MAEFKKRFDRGNKRAVNVEYRKLSDKRIRLKRKLAKAKTEEEKQSLLESIRELDKVHKSIPCKDPMDENFRRLQYVRYADYTEVETMPKLFIKANSLKRFQISFSA